MIIARKIILSCLALLFLCLAASAQKEMLMPLHSNPVIKKYLKEHPKTTTPNARTGSPTDTILLPFIDDFSYNGIYPNPNLWSDSDVYINRDYPINPPTLGVATFDGLNKYGNPYIPNAAFDSIADHLTSRHIKMDSTAIDTTIWLSFFYQPQGNSYYPPYPADSLILEFEHPLNFASGTVNVSDSLVTWTGGDLFVTADNAWNGVTIIIDSIPYQVSSVTSTGSLILSSSIGALSNVNYNITYNTWDEVWSIPGTVDTAFQQVMINIRDSTYLNSGFRFRFTNIANLGGNVDQWNIDYVRLYRDRFASDTAFTNEGAFLYRNKSLLVPPYTSMPYSHYKTNPSLYTVTRETALYKNLTSDSLNFSNDFWVVNDTGIPDYKTGINTVNVPPYSTFQNTKSINYVFPSLSQSSLQYSTWNMNTVAHQYNLQNDTVKELQVLSNYYSYDDGTAESAFGIWNGTDNTQGSLALQFDLKMPDTLRGVQFFWDQVPEPPGSNPQNLLLNIAVWDQLTPGTNNSDLIYQIIDASPENDSTINGFYTYVFDTPLLVQGTIYIGWIQFEQAYLNVGFDVNTDSHSLLYFNVLDTWQQSAISGSVMIRPLFGSAVNVGVKEVTQPDFNVHVFPNPASGIMNISVNSKNPSTYSFQLFDAIGKLVTQQKETTLDVSKLEEGFYMLKITDDKNSQFVTSKIIIRH